MSQKGSVHIFVIIVILLIGLVVTLKLAQTQQIIKPKAYETNQSSTVQRVTELSYECSESNDIKNLTFNPIPGIKYYRFTFNNGSADSRLVGEDGKVHLGQNGFQLPIMTPEGLKNPLIERFFWYGYLEPVADNVNNPREIDIITSIFKQIRCPKPTGQPSVISAITGVELFDVQIYGGFTIIGADFGTEAILYYSTGGSNETTHKVIVTGRRFVRLDDPSASFIPGGYVRICRTKPDYACSEYTNLEELGLKTPFIARAPSPSPTPSASPVTSSQKPVINAQEITLDGFDLRIPGRNFGNQRGFVYYDRGLGTHGSSAEESLKDYEIGRWTDNQVTVHMREYAVRSSITGNRVGIYDANLLVGNYIRVCQFDQNFCSEYVVIPPVRPR